MKSTIKTPLESMTLRLNARENCSKMKAASGITVPVDLHSDKYSHGSLIIMLKAKEIYGQGKYAQT